MFIADVVDHGLNDREKFWEFVLENPFRNLICGPVNYGRGRVFFRSWIVRSRYGFWICLYGAGILIHIVTISVGSYSGCFGFRRAFIRKLS